MKLTLSGKYLNSTYADENGRIIYKVRTGGMIPGASTSIAKILPDDIPRRENETGQEEDRFAHFARVNWKDHRILVRGEELPAKKFLRLEGWRRSRIFVGDDGKEYKWIFKPAHPELQLNDGSKTQVARYHQRNITGIFGAKRPGVLEIFPAGEAIVDTIVMTFVYIETARRHGGSY